MDEWTYRELEIVPVIGSASRRSGKLTALARKTWPDAQVRYWREDRSIAPMSPGGRHYQLRLARVEVRPPIYLGDCEDAAAAKLRALIEQ